MGFKVKLIAPPTWKRFTKVSGFKTNLEREIKKATIKNSLLIIKEVGRKVRSKDYTENAPLTLALSKGTIPLLKEKNMLDAMSFALSGAFRSEVGFIVNKQSTGGITGNTIGMMKLVELMETGYTITVTRPMIAAIMASLDAKRTKKGNLTGKARKALKAIESGEGAKGKRTWRVPPRKFMTEVMKDKALGKLIRQNYSVALEKFWKKQGVTSGEHKERSPKK